MEQQIETFSHLIKVLQLINKQYLIETSYEFGKIASMHVKDGFVLKSWHFALIRLI
jgi:hypothetical protein